MPTRLADHHRTLANLLNQEARQVEPAVLDDVLYRAALAHVGWLIGALTDYQAGRAVPPVSAQLTTRVSEELRPLQLEATVTANNAGAVTRPAALLYPLSLTARYEAGEDLPPITSAVQVLPQHTWGARLVSLLCRPSQADPIARVTPTGWLVVPAPDSVDVTGYRAPVRPVLVYVVDGNGEPVLDPVTDEPQVDEGATVDAEWLPLSDADIIRRACELLGLRTGDRPAQEFARVTSKEPS